jgi:hypothetical protein
VPRELPCALAKYVRERQHAIDQIDHRPGGEGGKGTGNELDADHAPHPFEACHEAPRSDPVHRGTMRLEGELNGGMREDFLFELRARRQVPMH